jgi:peptidoglycan/LPS O-acetylase OafA/YrhL
VADVAESRLTHLDGLRAVLVLAVMAHHIEATFKGWVQPVFKAGWLPVDGFFVLSGLLITTALLREHRERARIGVARFQFRRMARIYPALLVVLAAIAVVAVTIDRRPLGDVSPSLASAASWGHNFGYRSVSPLLTEVGPLWSLGVELQFYLVFPLVVAALLWLRTPRWVWVTLLAAVIASSASGRAQLGVARFPDSYLWTHVRLDSLMWGVLLAVALEWGWLQAVPRRAAQAVVVIASAVLVSLYLTSGALDPATYTWGITVAGVASAALVGFLLIRPDGALGAALRWSPLVALGRRSYSAYLWHQAVFMFLFRHTAAGPWARPAIGFAVTFVLADLTYRFVERPTLAWARRAGQPANEPATCRVAALSRFHTFTEAIATSRAAS